MKEVNNLYGPLKTPVLAIMCMLAMTACGYKEPLELPPNPEEPYFASHVWRFLERAKELEGRKVAITGALLEDETALLITNNSRGTQSAPDKYRSSYLMIEEIDDDMRKCISKNVMIIGIPEYNRKRKLYILRNIEEITLTPNDETGLPQYEVCYTNYGTTQPPS